MSTLWGVFILAVIVGLMVGWLRDPAAPLPDWLALLRRLRSWIEPAWNLFRAWFILKLPHRPYLRVVAISALVLSPLWFWLMWVAVTAITSLTVTADEVKAEDLRWHYLALGSMIIGFVTIVGAPLALIRVWTSERQTHTIEQGHVTDRITKAIEQLGAEKTVKRREFKQLYRVKNGRYRRDNDGDPIPAKRGDGSLAGEWESVEETTPNLEVRLGAIYALERIAQDSARDHVPIMETLCAYVRENAPAAGAKLEWKPPQETMDWHARKEAIKQWCSTLGKPRVDIQAILDVVGRRSKERVAEEQLGQRGFRLPLSRTALQRAALSDACLDMADLGGARLEGAFLWRARLKRAHLAGTRLDGAYLELARLDGAGLEGANLEGAYLARAHLERAGLVDAQLRGAFLQRVQMQQANLARAQLEGAYLEEARMEGTNLWGARLKEANLREARLDGARLLSADLTNWNCARCSLRSVDFTGCRGLELKHVESAFGVRAGFGRTTLPEGMTYPGHWHVSAEAERDNGELQQTYEQAYRAWLQTELT